MADTDAIFGLAEVASQAAVIAEVCAGDLVPTMIVVRQVTIHIPSEFITAYNPIMNLGHLSLNWMANDLYTEFQQFQLEVQTFSRQIIPMCQ